MIFGSVCSGIEAASVAWHPLGWRASFLSEIEAFPRAVLSHHYPEVPLHGDFTTIRADEYEPIDLLVGGTPCQSFSVAGLRGGLDDDRGNLALEYLRLADRLRPRWLVWENVPGVFSSASHIAPDLCPPDIDLDAGDGPADGEEVVVEDQYNADESHAFSCILAGFSELGYGFAYRVLDAQFFGVAQRRRRVFVVGHLGDWRRAAAVLFERHSLQGHPAPRRETGPSVAALTAQGVGTCGADDNQGQAGHLIPEGHCRETAPTLNAAFGSKLGLDNQHIDSGAGMFVAHTLKGEGFDASVDGTGRGTPTVPVAFSHQAGGDQTTLGSDPASGTAPTLGSTQTPAICFSAKDHGADAMSDLAPTLRAGGHSKSHANAGVMPAIAYGITRDALDRTGEGSGQTSGERAGLGIIEEQAQTIKAKGPGAVAFAQNTRDEVREMPYVGALAAEPGMKQTSYIRQSSAVRRLTPRECERLQGFPDDYTLIPYRKGQAADGPRYKALGNSMAVPVMRWIGERIAQVDAIPHAQIERSAS